MLCRQSLWLAGMRHATKLQATQEVPDLWCQDGVNVIRLVMWQSVLDPQVDGLDWTGCDLGQDVHPHCLCHQAVKFGNSSVRWEVNRHTVRHIFPRVQSRADSTAVPDRWSRTGDQCRPINRKDFLFLSVQVKRGNSCSENDATPPCCTEA